MRLGRSLFLSSFLIIAACGPGSGKNLHPEDPLALFVPDWTTITYTKDGHTVTLSPPFLTTQNIFADAATGSCTGNAMEIIFSGTYNPDTISKLELSGLTTTSNISGNNFTFTACMAQGSAAVTITAYDKDGKAIRLPLTVSLNAMTSTKTLGFGHPRYPNTGFTTMNAAPPLKNFTTGSVQMANAYLGSVAGKTTISTGNTGYTMETGFTNYVKQSSP